MVVERILLQSPVQVTTATVGAAEDGAVSVDLQLTHFTAQRRASLRLLPADAAETFLLTSWTEAVSHRDPDQRRSHGGTSRTQRLQAFLMTHEVTHFTQEAEEPPHEVAAAVAEGGFGQGDSLEAVARCGALVLVPEPGGLLRPLLHRQRARSPAVSGVRVRRSGPAAVGHVFTHKVTTGGKAHWEGLRYRKAWISRKCSTPSGDTSHRAGHSGAARRKGAVFGTSAELPLLRKLITQVLKYRVGHDFVIQTRLVFF